MDKFIAMYPPILETIYEGGVDHWGFRKYKNVERQITVDVAPFTETLIGSGQEVGCTEKVDFFSTINLKWTPSTYEPKSLYYVVPSATKTASPVTCRNYVLPHAKQTFPKFRKVLYIQSSLADHCIDLLHALEDYLGMDKSAALKLADRSVLTYKIIFNGHWIKNPMRYSFITYVLKCGMLYKGPDIKTFVDSNPTDEERRLYLAGVPNYRGDGSWTITQPKFQYILKEKKLDSLDAYEWKTWKLTYGGSWGFKDASLIEGYLVCPDHYANAPLVDTVKAKIIKPAEIAPIQTALPTWNQEVTEDFIGTNPCAEVVYDANAMYPAGATDATQPVVGINYDGNLVTVTGNTVDANTYGGLPGCNCRYCVDLRTRQPIQTIYRRAAQIYYRNYYL